MINLEDVLNHGTGMQALTGASGLGFPEVAAQWIEGAGDGAIFRGSRLRSRNIDIPLLLQAADRPRLQEMVGRLEQMLSSGLFQWRWYEDDGTYWSTDVAWQAGGGWIYGQDTIGQRDLRTTVTLRAQSPYWTYSVSASERVQNTGASRGLLNGSLTKMRISASQAIGTMRLNNDLAFAPSYPVWTVVGPGSNFIARSPSGQTLHWTGTILAGSSITLDARKGTVVDGSGANLYGQLAAAPKFWPVPPGTSVCTASLEGATTASSITCTWQPRRRVVI